MHLTYLPSEPTPTALDIVWCRFPYEELPDQPGPKPRPALVRSVRRKNNKLAVEVAYGTSNMSRYGRRILYVCNLRDMMAAQLPQATAFDLDRRLVLPWAEEFFSGRQPGQSPIIGKLPPQSIEQLTMLQTIRPGR
jgi:hypothetical protein